jgi:hypothetical protein
MDNYKRLSAALPKSSAALPNQISDALAANTRLIEAMDRSIATLERGETEGCFAKHAAIWKKILDDLRIKRSAFDAERQILLKAKSASADKPKADWKTTLAPFFHRFSICVVQTKRKALALDSKKPSPQDFALIMRGACNTEEFAIEAEQKRMQGWTAENRHEIKQALDSVRARAISEYSESFYGMGR